VSKDRNLKNGKRQKKQLVLPLYEDHVKSEALKHPRQGVEPLLAETVTENSAKLDHLMEEVCNPTNLKEALHQVKSKKGSPGVDGMTVGQMIPYLLEHWEEIRTQLLSGTYVPQPVRRVWIPKHDGSKRKLGIPTVIDRFIQQAILHVLTRYYDPTFSESSFGFRPGRSCHDAIRQSQDYINEGYTTVIDMDIEKFFDQVNHDKLMGLIARRIGDTRLLRLIRRYLQAGIMEGGLASPTIEGTPQGGPLSPLLSNIVLDELDRELEKRGHKFVRYADDCNIHVKSARAGIRVMAKVEKFVNKKLLLRLNSSKSMVSSPEKRQFLGFSFYRNRGGEWKIKLSDKTTKRFKKRIRELTRRGRRTFLHVVATLSEYIRGWRGYYGIVETQWTLRDYDSWIRRRLRSLIWKQWKGKRRYKELRKRGCSVNMAWNVANGSIGSWQASGKCAMTRAFPNRFFNDKGLAALTSYK
jgi:RNA-directed DNA polymerase